MPITKLPAQMTAAHARRIIGNPERYANWPENMRSALFRRAWSTATSVRKHGTLHSSSHRPFSGDAA